MDAFAFDPTAHSASATFESTKTYVLHGDGKRASKVAGSTTTNYAYDVNRPLPVALTDGTLKYVWGNGLAYATNLSGTIRDVYHTDGLGSVRAITDANGNVTQTYQTDEFGVSGLTQATNPQPYRFTGEPRDNESGFSYLRARYYVPTLGRFLSRDPLFGSLASPTSLNRFAYAADNAANWTDPSGLATAGSGQLPLSSSATSSMVLRDSKDPALTGQDDYQECSGNLLTFCGLWAVLPGGGLVAGILWDPCWLQPWTCDKDEGGGSGRRSDHSEIRRVEGRRTGPAYSDAAGASRSQVALDATPDTT